MDSIQRPAVILMNTEELYNEFSTELKDVLTDERDISELFNQAIDFITDPVSCEYTLNHCPNVGMLRTNSLKTSNNLTGNGMRVHHRFNMLCGQLIKTLTELNTIAIIDQATGKEIYPYYFLKIKNGNILLKRL
jgi:hypothetical protein